MLIRVFSHKGSNVATSQEQAQAVAETLLENRSEWLEQLAGNPDSLRDVERDVDQQVRTAGGQFVAALLQEASETSACSTASRGPDEGPPCRQVPIPAAVWSRSVRQHAVLPTQTIVPKRSRPSRRRTTNRTVSRTGRLWDRHRMHALHDANRGADRRHQSVHGCCSAGTGSARDPTRQEDGSPCSSANSCLRSGVANWRRFETGTCRLETNSPSYASPCRSTADACELAGTSRLGRNASQGRGRSSTRRGENRKRW